MSGEYFPFDLFNHEILVREGGPIGDLIRRYAPRSMCPPYPWGQWLYARLIEQRCVNIRGDFIECGVGEGGMTLFLAHLARTNGRKVYALDSFEGLPRPTAADNPYFRKGDYGADREEGSLFARFIRDVKDNDLCAVIITRKGWFSKTLRKWPSGQRFAFAHIDADLHASVLECLKAIYPRLSEGGVLAIDDFFHHAQGPARAVSEYFSSIHHKPVLNLVFPYGVLIVKGEEPSSNTHRSLDGHRYSLRFLREDKLFRRAVEESAAKAERAGKDVRAKQARRLLGLLQVGSPDTSVDVYEYWSAMQAFWDDMDHDTPSARKPMKL